MAIFMASICRIPVSLFFGFWSGNFSRLLLNSFLGKNLLKEYRTWENFGEFGERLAIHQNFPHQYL